MDVIGSYDPYVEVKLRNYKGITQHFEKEGYLKGFPIFHVEDASGFGELVSKHDDLLSFL